MKRRHILLSIVILSLPLIYLWIAWRFIPTRLPVQFDHNDKPLRLAPRQEWLRILLSVMFVLTLIRGGLLALLSSRIGEVSPRFVRVSLLSAAFVTSILGLFILKTVYGSANFLPILLCLFGAAGVYLTVPTKLDSKCVDSQQRKKETQELLQTARFVLIRVNVLAALMMIFVRSEHHWMLGLSANALALAGIIIITKFRRSSG